MNRQVYLSNSILSSPFNSVTKYLTVNRTTIVRTRRTFSDKLHSFTTLRTGHNFFPFIYSVLFTQMVGSK